LMIVDLGSVADAFRQSEGEAVRLTSGLTSEQANWRPRAGAWSIWQALDHLAKVNLAYVPALQAALAACPERLRTATIAVAPGWLGRWFVGQMEPPVRTKFKTPAKGTPSEEGQAQEALKRF